MSVGSVTLKTDMTCRRCAMAIHGFCGLPRDPQIMRKLVANSEGTLGLYVSIVQAGKVTIGDSVTVM